MKTNLKRFSSLFYLLILIVSLLFGCSTMESSETSTEVSSSQNVILSLAALNSLNIDEEVGNLIKLQEMRTSDDIKLIEKWDSHPVLVWNEQARYWVIYYERNPALASRVYALISVAQQRALDNLALAEDELSARHPKNLSEDINPVALQSDPFESAALIGASETVLLYLFPENANDIQITAGEARNALLISGNILPVDLVAAETLGQTVAEKLINERKNDGTADAKKVESLPTGEGIWKPDAFRAAPEMPGWGRVRPWLLSSGDQFRADPPPVFQSPEFNAALDEVRQTMLTNRPLEQAIAEKWKDKTGTVTPPGHWNLIAADLIIKYKLTSQDSAHVLALLNMAMMDAGIAGWDSKYFYMVVRPWQADPSISTLVGYPNHPSYPSGHSVFSWSAAEVLSYFFPNEREDLLDMAEEASMSRLYGGIHYRFDMEAGKKIGIQVGELAQDFAKKQGW